MQNTQVKTLVGQRLRAARTQRGYSLPELAIVILVIGLLASIAALILPNIFASYRAGKITDEFNIAIPAIQTAYQNRTSYAGLTTAQVAQNRWVGSGMTEITNGVPSGNILTPWGQLTFASASNNTQGQGTLNNIPGRECIRIVTAMAADQYLNVTVNGTSVKAGTDAMDLTASATACNTAAGASTIVFTFGRA
jgi:prepilin-type N-terminal cleavage/methylation domain-containing protein